MITLADKSKTIVIIYKHEYNNKVHTFLKDNNFHTLHDDQIRIQKTAQHCNQINPEQHIKYLTQPPHPHTKCTTKTPQTRSPYPTGYKQQNCTLI